MWKKFRRVCKKLVYIGNEFRRTGKELRKCLPEYLADPIQRDC